jgi:8-amino-7-oxononanoate synthase
MGRASDDADRPPSSDSRSLAEVAAAQLRELDKKHLRRIRRTIEILPPPGFGPGAPDSDGLSEPVAVVEGQLKLVFCSNDYLGLSRDPRVISAFQGAAGFLGVGSGASHLVTGHHREHHALEEELAEFVGRERALLFSTGYHANLGVVSALLGRNDTIFEDRLNHASLIDAALLSRAELVRYAHADVAAAEAALAAGHGRKLLATDGVFSMDGDIAPVQSLAAAARKHGAWLMVDDAHGLGVIGASGRGTGSQLSSSDVPLLMGTLGKALGTFGAFVAGDRDAVELLVQRARTYIYTTALPPAVASATRVALRIAAADDSRRARLHANIARFRAGAGQLGVQLLPSQTPIQPLVIGDNERALAASEYLWERGFWVSAIRPPTVPDGTARLRITLSAAHSSANIDALVAALTSAVAHAETAAT